MTAGGLEILGMPKLSLVARTDGTFLIRKRLELWGHNGCFGRHAAPDTNAITDDGCLSKRRRPML